MRRETEQTALVNLPQSVVAHRLGRIAYWTDVNGMAELHVVEVPGPDQVAARFAQRRGVGIAWSVDGTGLVVSLAEPDPRFVIARALHTVDLASGKTAEVYRSIGPSGASVMPLVWRRDIGLIAAYETGPGGFHFGYTVIRAGSPPTRTDPVGRVTGMQASFDGSHVVGVWLDDQAIQVWPVDDLSQQTELKITGADIAQPQWIPGRHALTYTIATGGPSAARSRLEQWDPATGARSLIKDLGPGDARAYLLRADGSGVIVQLPSGGWEVTDLSSGASAAVPIASGETLVVTVLLRG